MKRFAKATALLLAFAMLLQLPVIAAQEEAETKTKLDSFEFHVLDALGLIAPEMKELDAEAPMTRAQFAYAAAELFGGGLPLEAGATGFSDVPADHWCAAQINLLRQRGILGGVNGYQFAPDDEITYEQAVKVAVSAVGYGVLAEGQYGGYPAGYFVAANRIKLLGGILNAGDTVTAAAGIRLLYNTANTDILDSSAAGAAPEYNVVDGRTLLSRYRDIYRDRGVMTDNGVTAITGPSGQRGTAVIGEDTLTAAKEFEPLIGRYVEYYYKRDGQDKELVYAAATDRNTTLTIAADDLAPEAGGFGMNSIAYRDEDDEIRYAAVDDRADLIYNGRAYPQFGIETIKISAGSLTLIDNNGDGTYEVIAVREFQNLFVSSADAKGKVIYGKYGDTIELSGYRDVEILTETGAPTQFEAIKANTVVSYEKSKNQEAIVLYAVNRAVSGSVSEIIAADDPAESEFTIDGKVYRLAKSFLDAVGAGKLNTEVPKMGRSYTLYLDREGKIAGMGTMLTESTQYAYLVAIGKDSGLDDTVQMRLVMPNGEIFNTYTAEKIRLNDSSVKVKSAELMTNPAIVGEDGEVIQQVVKVKMNALGDVTDFSWAQPVMSEYGYDPERFTKDFTGADVTYKGNNQMTFNGKYSLNKNTIIFSVPSGGKVSAEDVKVESPSILIDGRNYTITLYDTDATLAAKVAVTEAGGKFETSLFLVDKVGSALNEDGEAVKMLSGVCYGAYVTYAEEREGIIPEGIKQGDVCRVGLLNNQVTSFVKFTSLADRPAPHTQSVEGTGVVNTMYSTVFGYLYARSDNAITTYDDTPEAAEKLYAHSLNGGAAKVSIYDAAAGRVSVGSLADVYPNTLPNADGSFTVAENSVMTYVYRRYDYAREIIVVRY